MGNWLDSGYISKLMPVGFADISDMGYVGKRKFTITPKSWPEKMSE